MERPRTLVIDDEQIVLDSVRRILEAEGMAVDSSLNAREGLALALQRPYQLVLSDIRMPVMGGMRVLRDIKRARPALPVVIITGFSTVASAVQAMKLGASDYVEKPFAPEDLLKAVRGALERAATTEPETQSLVHRDEVLRVLERASIDAGFMTALLFSGADALEGYTLTGAEKLAILTGDIQWIESHAGTLTPTHRRWLDQRLSAEIW